jgi:hypothetical protein
MSTKGEILKAKSTYGCKWFKHAIDVVNYENGLENRGILKPQNRMTCGTCKTFEIPEHVAEHSSIPQPRSSMQGFF